MIALLTAAAISATTWITPSEWRIVDGDTIQVNFQDVDLYVRLQGIDAPERAQEGGPESTTWLRTFIEDDAAMHVEVTDTDRWGRLVGWVWVDGVCVNREIVKQGHAWHYVKYAKGDKQLAWAEQYARDERRGLWASPVQTPPWEWRKR